jgi:hypothetical protein
LCHNADLCAQLFKLRRVFRAHFSQKFQNNVFSLFSHAGHPITARATPSRTTSPSLPDRGLAAAKRQDLILFMGLLLSSSKTGFGILQEPQKPGSRFDPLHEQRIEGLKLAIVRAGDFLFSPTGPFHRWGEK